MHMIPLINVTHSGISIWVCLEIFVTLLKAQGSNNPPKFCYKEGYMLLSSTIESVCLPIL